MVFTKREKIILAATIAALALLVLDAYVLTPLLDERQAVAARRDRLRAEMAQANAMLNRRRVLGRVLDRMMRDGMKRDPAEAESLFLRSLRDWCADAGLRLASLRPQRSTEKTPLPEITVDLAGTGPMAAVSRLILQIERARIPARIKMVQIGSRKDGYDDLSLHLKVSTLYAPSGQAAHGKGAGDASDGKQSRKRIP